MELKTSKGIDDAIINGQNIEIHTGEAATMKVQEILRTADEKSRYPAKIDEAAFHGIAGEIVRAIDYHTEADPIAVLLQFLVAFGNIIGRNPHFIVGGGRHGTNLFLVCVGNTSNGRKGTAWDCVQYLIKQVDESWLKERVFSGSASGEGWIWAVRDEIRRSTKVKRGEDWSVEEVVEDLGISDKRALILEEEFATLLKVMSREGNTLSDIVRKAWDGKTLRSLTKNSPATATDPHISLIGHITKDELTRHFSEVEAANGFGNRILWSLVKRSKLLPNGGDLCNVDFSKIIAELKASVDFSKVIRPFIRDRLAETQWEEAYRELTRDRQGLLGALCARMAPLALRLAIIYAVLDCSAKIQSVHLEAALAVIGYCEDSCRYIFGEKLGDPVADEILLALKHAPNGRTRTEIRDIFGRNRASHQISAALGRLQIEGLARVHQEGSGGRPSERWYAKC